MKYFVIFFTFVVFVVGTNTSFAQYYGQLESHEFFVSYEGQHKINLQSSITKFNNVFYDDLANSIIISVDSDNTSVDIISIWMDVSSFRTLLTDGKNIEPSDVLILLDGEEQEYYTPHITNDNVTWEFKNKPNVMEIEIIQQPNRDRGASGMEHWIAITTSSQPVKKQHELGIPFENMLCKKQGQVIITKYDGTPACVKEQSITKLIERGWAILTPEERLYDIEKILNDDDCVEFGRWLDEHAEGSFNENLLIFDLPVPYALSERIYDSIPNCISDQSGFFNLNTKHIIDFEKLEKDSSKPIVIEEKYQERYNIEIVGLKDEYVLGEEYSFYFVISGYGHECAGLNLSYPDEYGKLQGWGQMPLCDPDVSMHEFKTNYYDRGDTFGNVAIKNPGTYTVTVMFDQPNKYFPTTASKEFHVVEK